MLGLTCCAKDDEVLEGVSPDGGGSLMLMGTPSSNIPATRLAFGGVPAAGTGRSPEAQSQCLQVRAPEVPRK